MWLYLALLAALITATNLFIVKHLLKTVHPISLAVLVHVFTIPFMFLALYYTKIPATSPIFYIYIAIAGLMAGAAAYSSYKAFSCSQISLLVPLAAFIPILTLIWGSIFLGETPTLVKLLGVIIIVIGAYVLDLHDIKKGILQPFEDLFQDKGTRLYLLAIILWSLTPIFEKQAIAQTSPTTPIFAAFMSILISTTILIPFAMREKITLDPVKKHWVLLIILGFIHVIFLGAMFTAFTLTNVAYVVAVSRVAILFVIIFGALVLHEQRLKERFLAGILMAIGIFLVAI